MAGEPKLSGRLRAFLDGREGKAARKAMEILLALARVFGAERFVPVSSAQISGVSYATLSDAGLEFLESFAEDGRVRVPAVLNPAGMDLQQWREMGVGESFAEKQKRVLDAYRKMGVTLTCTCTPYLAGLVPRKGELLAWGESSAVTFVNSVIGARTNREGGPAALAAAVVGEAPLYGLHLDANRMPRIEVRLKGSLRSAADYGALGIVLGKRIGGDIPLLESGFEPTSEGLRALSAALPTYSGVSLFHWRDVTPEWRQWKPPGDTITVGPEEIEAARLECGSDEKEVSLVFTGCPHLGIEEVQTLAGRLRGRRVGTPFWIFTSRRVVEIARQQGLVEPIEEAGAKIFSDTCPVVAPSTEKFDSVMTDSAKGCYYMRGVHGSSVHLASPDECIDRALAGPAGALL